MKLRVVSNRFLLTLTALLLFASNSLSAMAQCAMCKASVQGGANATQAAQTLNLAVLVLLVPPALLFCAIFYLLMRYRGKGSEEEGVALETLEAFD